MHCAVSSSYTIIIIMITIMKIIIIIMIIIRLLLSVSIETIEIGKVKHGRAHTHTSDKLPRGGGVNRNIRLGLVANPAPILQSVGSVPIQGFRIVSVLTSLYVSTYNIMQAYTLYVNHNNI